MTYVYNVNASEYKIAILILHTTETIVESKYSIKKEQSMLSRLNEHMVMVYKTFVSASNRITVKYMYTGFHG